MKQTLYSAFAQESNGGQVDHQELLKMADKIVKQATSKLHSQVFVNFWLYYFLSQILTQETKYVVWKFHCQYASIL